MIFAFETPRTKPPRFSAGIAREKAGPRGGKQDAPRQRSNILFIIHISTYYVPIRSDKKTLDRVEKSDIVEQARLKLRLNFSKTNICITDGCSAFPASPDAENTTCGSFCTSRASEITGFAVPPACSAIRSCQSAAQESTGVKGMRRIRTSRTCLMVALMLVIASGTLVAQASQP